ncbi:hypothetical protein XCR1_4640001 [Xenorhabdus cabanillasii JM26]|uniref:Uncharacterized protein n=1 Tax=Xenorhabdus cabanillasii JM26 TaxID=1427517 RepID=W1JB44_9GAMM|nr:DUF6201 family protein [Xenorhabdus cabanillasii]PHM73380.1 hypothetical protein Xcab_04343 [Xenorhabdus cabanillasii JM26]CDL86740.1 hypothetical protein XCR1_4640001 [Xenorhabdus cabanillasii JM26]
MYYLKIFLNVLVGFYYSPKYIFLYDNDYNFIDQSSPFYFSSKLEFIGGEHMLRKINLIDKDKSDTELYISSVRCQEGDAIAEDKKEW